MSSVTVYATGVLFAVLAITDFVSDVKLLISLRKTRDEYLADQDYIASVIESNSYDFEYCFPIQTQPVWHNEVHESCSCTDAMVTCDSSTANPTITLEEIYLDGANNGSQNTYAFMEQLVQSTVSCKPFVWGQDYIHMAAFNFASWNCTHCECTGNLYDVNSSFAMIQAANLYDALYDDQITYCDPAAMVDPEHTDHLNGLVVVCTVFVVIGAVAQCCALGGTGWLTYLAVEEGVFDKDDTKSDTEDAAIWFLLKMALTFMLSLFEDVPQTIVAMYYLQFLYHNTGFYCYDDFAEYPRIERMHINPKDSIMVILFENPSIAFAVAMSLIMIVLSGIQTGFKVLTNVNEEVKDEGVGFRFFAVTVVIGVTVLYVFNLLMPIAAIAYFDIAPTFHKDWNPAFNTFVTGCVTWGLTYCFCCVFGVLVSKG